MQKSKSDSIKESTKQKLTLGIDESVIQRAKAAGINISEVTEYLLKAITYEPNDVTTRHDVAKAYDALFKQAWSLMAKYTEEGFEIDVGRLDYNMKGHERMIRLIGHIGLSVCDDDTPSGIIEGDVPVDKVLDCLYDPIKILQNLIVKLTEVAHYNKKKLAELKFALRLIKAMYDNEEEGEHKN